MTNAAACGSGGLAFRAPGVALVFGAALGVSGCIGPDVSEIGDYGAALSPFATASVSGEAPAGADLRRLHPQGRNWEAAAREQAPEAHFALATMTIPPGHHPGSIEAPIWGQANGKSDIMVAGERELDGDEFRAELASHISGRIGVNRDILVFVHGFNTSFDEARSRAAQIVADTHFGGVAVLFTWPSKSDLFGYVSDKESATASRDALQALLHDLGQTPGRRQDPGPRPFDGRLADDGGAARVRDRRRPGLSAAISATSSSRPLTST